MIVECIYPSGRLAWWDQLISNITEVFPIWIGLVVSHIFRGLVGQVRPERIGIRSHRLGQSSHAGHAEFAWIADAENCVVLGNLC